MSYDVWLESDEDSTDGRNYTSNVAGMWRKAMPDTDGVAGLNGMLGRDAARHLAAGIQAMLTYPEAYEAMAPTNGWGDLDGAARFLLDLALDCSRCPDMTVRVDR